MKGMSNEEVNGMMREMMVGKPKKGEGGAGKVSKVMREFKAGNLKSSSGGKVKKRKQAIAIGMSEARRAQHKHGM